MYESLRKIFANYFDVNENSINLYFEDTATRRRLQAGDLSVEISGDNAETTGSLIENIRDSNFITNIQAEIDTAVRNQS